MQIKSSRGKLQRKDSLSKPLQFAGASESIAAEVNFPHVLQELFGKGGFWDRRQSVALNVQMFYAGDVEKSLFQGQSI